MLNRACFYNLLWQQMPEVYIYCVKNVLPFICFKTPWYEFHHVPLQILEQQFSIHSIYHLHDFCGVLREGKEHKSFHGNTKIRQVTF